MLNIIRADFYRIFRSKSIYIILILMLLIDISSIILDSSAMCIGVAYHNDSGIMMTSDANALTSNGNLYYFFTFVVVGILISDFTNKTIKNTLSSNCTRICYFLSKTFSVYIAATILFSAHNAFFYILNYFVNGSKHAMDAGEYAQIAILQMSVLFGMTGFMLMIGFLTKNGTAFNTLTLSLPLTYALILMFLYDYFPEIIENYLLKYEMHTTIGSLVYNSDHTYKLTVVTIYLSATVVLPILGYLNFRKSEIK